jgi:predicted metalloprotease
MARWENITSRGSVVDRRSFVPVAGGVSIAGIALIAAYNLLTGGNLGDFLNQVLQQSTPNEVVDTGEFAGQDSYEVFAATVLGSANDYWSETLGAQNIAYSPPRLVLFRQATQSGCGRATSDVGPHYCPIDSDIYLDETFFDELERRLGAEGGDVAEAYVIAHEVGHHVQNQLGLFERVGNSNEQSIRLELQADCYAGLWAHSVRDRNVFLPNEISEALDAAQAVGDDRIQEKVTGQVNPETWTHGSAAQRLEWFTRGYETGEFAQCDTF